MEKIVMSNTSFKTTTKAPGRAKKNRKSRYKARGRQATQSALSDVQSLLYGQPHSRDSLIENLHLLQDEYGGLFKDHLAALSEQMNLALVEVYEVATFYHNFTLLEDDEQAKTHIRVCDSLSCHMAGSKKLLTEIDDNSGDQIRVTKAACMGRCENAPVVRLDQDYVVDATHNKIEQELKTPGTHSQTLETMTTYASYEEDGGFSTLRAYQNRTTTYAELIGSLKESGHRGLGGAGFPHAVKIESVNSVSGPRYMAVNADESEPGTFKDRHYMNSNPYQFLEGMLIAAQMVSAQAIYIFLRDEYADTAEILKTAIATVMKENLASGIEIILRRGAGSYICGEESAMLESIEGKKAYPRQKPPFPAHVGLFGQPTLINNVETLYWLPDIIRKGADWYKTGGRHGSTGFRSFSLSGHVNKPGMYITPAGITASELIEEYGGGMAEGHGFKAYLPGGASGGLLPATMADIPLDFGSLEKYGCFIGSAAVIVLSDQDNFKEVGRNLMDFFEDESCGQCTPCRVGTEKALALMTDEAWDFPLLEELGEVMQQASICGLGQAAPNAMLSLMKYFPEDLA
jgi:formate dehydrogenase beta subunit